VLGDLGFSSPEASSENQCASVISVKVPSSVLLSLRKKKMVVNIPHTVTCSFKSVVSQKEFRIKIPGFLVLFLGLFHCCLRF